MTDAPKLAFIADLIEAQAEKLGDKPYIHFEEELVGFADFNLATRRVANGFANHGAQPGDGVALLMGNCPEYLYLTQGSPRAGLYFVPVNVSLKGDGLRHILTHSDVKFLVVDDTLYPNVAELEAPVDAIEKIFVRRTEGGTLAEGTLDIETLFDASDAKPAHVQEAGAMLCLLYTSGTTGLPKGVVNRSQPAPLERLQQYASAWMPADAKLYTCLPLFHANALQLTANMAMMAGVTFGLDKRFSASRFWDRIRHYQATSFNALGAMIPILMKQPEKANDGDNPVTRINSAACPANLWEAFEKRFNVTLWEGYGAVDGAGTTMMNAGNAPVGSVGKPDASVEWKLVDEDDNEVPQGEVGELVVLIKDKKAQSVEYYKNPEASSAKVAGGWVRSGDLFHADKDGNLFFADRKTDSMRRRGENISSWEVENVVEKHPAVAECAAFGVPSELGEDDVMIWVKPVEGQTIDLKDLMRHCAAGMAYFMVPQYVDVVDDIPRTGTHRVQKGAMKKQGATARTWDREKEMPELELKKPAS